jgi:hypothetical protein
MSSHVLEQLYDYLNGEIPAPERAAIQEHLDACPDCRASLETLRDASRIVPRGNRLPSDDREEAFWASLLDRVDDEIRIDRSVRGSPIAEFRARVGIVRFRRLRLAAAGTGALAMAAMLLVLLWPRQTPAPAMPDGSPSAVQPANEAPEVLATRRLNEYYRRSKVLMVGLANMKEQEERQLDLSREQAQSRTLVREARELRRYPLDHRSDRLVGDVQKILIGLSNINDTRKAPEVEILQAGIRRENLLFRVRMAEYATNITATEGNLQ